MGHSPYEYLSRVLFLIFHLYLWANKQKSSVTRKAQVPGRGKWTPSIPGRIARGARPVSYAVIKLRTLSFKNIPAIFKWALFL